MKKKIQLALASVLITQIIPLLWHPELIFNNKNLVIVAANLSLWLFQPAVSAKETSENKTKDGYSVVIILMMSVLSTIVPIVDWAYLSNSQSTTSWSTIAGFIIMWTGVLLRNYSIKLLGK